MSSQYSCRLLAVILAGCLNGTVVPARAQTAHAPAPEIQQKLNRIAADLFSTAPHASEAVGELKSILAAHPNLAEAHMLLGIAYRAQGTPELIGEAVAELRQAVALKPSLMLARLILARLYLDMSRAARARDELESAIEEMPGNPQLLSLLGETERQLGNPTRAAQLNREALQVDASFAQARYYLGLALIDLRQHKEAVREMQLVVKSQANPAEAHFGLGVAYLGAGQVKSAVTALRDAARLDPARPETRVQLARAYRLNGQLNEALGELAGARTSASGGLGALYRGIEADLHMEEGFVRMQLGQLEAAAQSFQKVLDADSSHAAAKQGLTETRKRLQERAQSKKPGKRP